MLATVEVAPLGEAMGGSLVVDASYPVVLAIGNVALMVTVGATEANETGLMPAVVELAPMVAATDGSVVAFVVRAGVELLLLFVLIVL